MTHKCQRCGKVKLGLVCAWQHPHAAAPLALEGWVCYGCEAEMTAAGFQWLPADHAAPTIRRNP